MNQSLPSVQPVLPLPAVAGKSSKFNLDLETLRGYAAIVVVWGHVIFHRFWLDPHYEPHGVLSYQAPGHLCVIVFFVLSGYVIGLNHQVPLQAGGILDYLKKRLVRIYPIYLVCLALALLAARHAYSEQAVLGNLLMLQNIRSAAVPLIKEINPSWSLHYEVLFYLLFIPLSYFRLNALLTTLACAVLGIITYLSGYVWVSTYFIGFALWLSGVVLSRRFQQSNASGPANYALMLSMLLLLLSLDKYNVFAFAYFKLLPLLTNHRVLAEEGIVRMSDFVFLPYCLLTVLVFANKQFPLQKFIVPLLLFAPGYTLVYLVRNPSTWHDPALVIPTICYLLAVGCYLFSRQLNAIGRRCIVALHSSGSISYGVYLVHFPIIALFIRVEAFSGTPVTFAVRAVLYVILCLSVSWLLEKKMQPRIKAFFFSQRAQ